MELDPELVFTYIANQIPRDLHEHVLVIGSLAAAYSYRDMLKRKTVNTKDADVVVQPAGAIDECRKIANRLLDEGWRRREGCVARASTAELTADDVIRLLPPERDNKDLYFVELLAFPKRGQTEPKLLEPIQLTDGWNVLPAFRHLGVLAFDQRTSSAGLRYASPQMMALANLLSHPTLGERKTTEEIGGRRAIDGVERYESRRLLRSAKDLGRVLALSHLAGRDEVETWPTEWLGAMRDCYEPDQVVELGARADDGLRALMNNKDALDDALHAVDVGILAGFEITPDGLLAIAERLLTDAVVPFAESVRSG
jgi:hypothetical protein